MKPISAWASITAGILSQPRGLFGVIVIGAIVATAIFAPLLAPFDPSKINYLAIAKPPSATYWLGTDEAGRDILSRLIYGARISVIVVVASIGTAMLLGSALGLLSGYMSGWADEIIMRIVDSILSFPTMVLALLVIALIGPGLTNAIIAMAIVYAPNFARLVRGETLSLRNREFVAAAVVSGGRWGQIVLEEILPNLVGNVLVYGSLLASTALITEAALSFLGLGIQPPTPSWGYMISAGMQHWSSWWISFYPGLAIFIAVIGFNFLGDALRDALDPATSKK
jgi:peptide/nickel transport system permease protein